MRAVMIYPVILCGGSGTRLWPVSRRSYPKQFARLLGETSLYQASLGRFSKPGYAAPLVVATEDFRFLAVDQAAAIGLHDLTVLIEPAPRDTGPAVLIAALRLVEEDPDAVLLIAPSDHVIADPDAFHAAVERGSALLEEPLAAGRIVTFGVVPDRPETGYGYLDLGADARGGANDRSGEAPAATAAAPAQVRRFREKPDAAAAEAMLAAGHYLWNAGLFLVRGRDLIEAFESHAPDLLPPCRQALVDGAADLGFFRLSEAAYIQARGISFDYAVMEKADAVWAVPMACGWSDLGAWDSLWRYLEPDAKGMVAHGAVTALECNDSYLHAEEGTQHLVGLGLRDVIAVSMRDAVLVADRSRAQDVKRVVETLRAARVAQADTYPRFHRPWGWYETLCLGARFQVKRIMVKPDGMLSLQSHLHRAEHWVVVAGTAEITIADERRTVTENESVYIPLGAQHRLANHGKLPVYLIEVQTGAYLGEDDIVRYEDIYSRS